MEAATALQCAVGDAPVGSCVFGAVRDYGGRRKAAQQGTALFIVCGSAWTDGSVVHVPVRFGGGRDAYYRWWGQTTSGPLAVGARMQIVVCQNEYTDPDENELVLRGALVLDTEIVPRSGCERYSGCSFAQDGTESRPPPRCWHPVALQQVLGGDAAETSPEEMMSREELIEQLAAARLEVRQGRGQEEKQERGVTEDFKIRRDTSGTDEWCP
eukprot:2498902-Amphidinium_carterae.1